MEQGLKKIIMLVVIVACIIAAVAITVLTGGDEGDVSSISEDEKIWLICRNPECEHSWEMGKRDYYQYVDTQKKKTGFNIPGQPCPKCGEDSGYRAIKCKKCGFVFEKNSVPNDLADRCPKCKFSETESVRRNR